MSATSKLLTKLKEQLPEETAFSEDEVLSDERYKRGLVSLLKDAVQKGRDFAQTEDGRVLVTETKPVTYEYLWNQKKGKFERAKSGARARRLRANAKTASNLNEAPASAPKRERELADA